ncbi:Hypothetical protein LUCI_3864 [Lucifera butyrica]|uniref:PcfJ-like protein n=1 Tax=Lucifera butyrica TaxID=1351585 RepID=A0A498R760_9FIRM|nr:PcfJ domain-containing protein [Lucifera butyrica]VBB08586.1 Hypothetical protein LUCI_3864 [Lucifera butyrica]
MLPQTAEQILSHFRQAPVTKDLQQFVRKNAFNQQYLFIRKKGDTTGYCSFCQKDVPLKDRSPLWHNTKTTCPRCRKEVAVKHVWRGIKNIADVAYVYHFARSVKNKQLITCQTFYVYRFLDGNPCAIEYSPSCYYVLSGQGAKMMYVQPYTREYILAKSIYTKNPSGDFYHYWRGKISANMASLARAIPHTPFQYSAWEIYTDMEEQILRYLALFAKYPQSEYLSKCGLSALLKSYLDKLPAARGVLNWRGKSLRKVLGFQPAKQELSHAGKADLAGGKLAHWIALRKSGCQILLPDLDAYGWLNETSVLSSLREIVPFDKLFTYQKRLEKRGELTAYFFRDYLDYLRECRQLGYDMSRKEILYPNKLAEKHIQNQLRIKQKRNRQLDQKISERYPHLVEKYGYAANNFCIVVPKSSSDLIAEGHYLRHCVGNYIDRYANGFTDIVFLRKAAEPAVAFYTLEIYDGEILQCRGFKNCSHTREIHAFLEEFKQHRLTKKRKKQAV